MMTLPDTNPAALEDHPMIDVMRENDGFIEALQTAVNSADFGLDYLPQLLFRIIDEHRWQCRYVRALKREVAFASFTEFATTATPAGLGTSLATLKRMCSDDRTAVDALDTATARMPGGANNPQGNNQHLVNGVIHPIDQEQEIKRDRSDKWRRRLREDFPALYKDVLEGTITVNSAAIEAGIFPKRLSINLQNVESAANAILDHATPEYIASLIDFLEGRHG